MTKLVLDSTNKHNSKSKYQLLTRLPMAFPVDIKYIVETEEKLGVLFPKSYKNKMIEENGGMIYTKEDNWQLHPFFDKSEKKRISRTCNHIILETERVRNRHGFPLEAVVIGSNGSGDHIVLIPKTTESKQLGEEIYSWYHEVGALEKLVDSIDGFK